MIATTVEQSKHLVEIGIPMESADMTYEKLAIGNNFSEELQYILCLTQFRFYSGIGVPAWSLSALLDLLPDMITVDNWDYDLDLQKCDNGYVVSYTYFPFADESEDLCYFKDETAVECVYRMVCWWFEWKDVKKS